MVSLTLKNHQQDASDMQITIDCTTQNCTMADGRVVHLKDVLKNSDFIHPLFLEPYTKASDDYYCYEYNSMEELLYAGIYVYTRLLHAEDPKRCQFHIKPSAPFIKTAQEERSIAFSLHACKSPQEDISIHQLESIVTDLLGERFDFAESMILDVALSLDNLPKTMDAERLYQSNPETLALLNKSMHLRDFELRYIGPSIGFGAYTKCEIKSGEVIALYVGKKVLSEQADSRYSFKPLDDCLNTSIDAGRWGNLMRFINHAPPHDDTSEEQSIYLESNITPCNFYSNGLHFVGYKANRDILPGEQLLVDYGKNYFKRRPMSRFNLKGQLVEVNHLPIEYRRGSLYLHSMVKHKIHVARRYLWKRRIFVFLSAILLLLIIGRVFIHG